VGATIFARRLIEVFDMLMESDPMLPNAPVVFQAGCFGVQDIRKEGLDAEKIVRRAHAALKRARTEGPGRRVEPYSQDRMAS
jgi:GGDEF domain-containing protein